MLFINITIIIYYCLLFVHILMLLLQHNKNYSVINKNVMSNEKLIVMESVGITQALNIKFKDRDPVYVLLILFWPGNGTKT